MENMTAALVILGILAIIAAFVAWRNGMDKMQ